MLDADGNPIMETADGTVGAPSQGIGLGNNAAGSLASQQGQAGQSVGGLQPSTGGNLAQQANPGAITDANGNMMPGMDPAAMGGMMPPGGMMPGMDPAAMGGMMPPGGMMPGMDPAAMGGMMPPGGMMPGMDPAAMGGMMPGMDPGAV